MLKKYMIEREIPGAGLLNHSQLGEAAVTSNDALRQLSGVQWQQSYVTAGGTYCIYLAESEEVIRRHAEISGFPANRIVEVTGVIDPSTERDCPKAVARAA
jgi:hypothetical protein